METNNTFKCHFCTTCNGYGCIGELPGMGGFSNNINFQNNCAAWKEIFQNLSQSEVEEVNNSEKPILRLGPMTGGVENAGYFSEKQFYFDIINHAISQNLQLSIGDGFPDEKLLFGIEAVKSHNKKAAVFIKPYPNNRILERIEWANPVAEYIGIDIDSYNIVTMRNLVKLEKKTYENLSEIKKHLHVPFALKGIFTQDDIELVKMIKPDVVFISNHGGRVENRIGSTAEFLQENAKTLSNYCNEIWVDGGIRTEQDAKLAKYLGANQVLIGRPAITQMCKTKLL